MPTGALTEQPSSAGAISANFPSVDIPETCGSRDPKVAGRVDIV